MADNLASTGLQPADAQASRHVRRTPGRRRQDPLPELQHLQAMDAKTGKALGSFQKYEKPPQTKHWPKGPPSQSPLPMGETVVWSVKDTTYGLHTDTGETLWENKTERFANHSLRKVTLGNRSLVLVVGQQHHKPSQVRVIDPQSGETPFGRKKQA